MLAFANSITMTQLQDCAKGVSQKKFKQAISEMFSTQIKFAVDYLVKWFGRKFKSKNLSLSLDKKIRYEKEHPINWENGKCCICNLPLEIKAKGVDVNAKEMDYLDLFIRKQPKFVINVLEDKELKKSTVLKSLSDYYNVFLKLTKVFLLLEDRTFN